MFTGEPSRTAESSALKAKRKPPVFALLSGQLLPMGSQADQADCRGEARASIHNEILNGGHQEVHISANSLFYSVCYASIYQHSHGQPRETMPIFFGLDMDIAEHACIRGRQVYLFPRVEQEGSRAGCAYDPQPPPKALMSSTLADMRRAWMSAALRSADSAALWAVLTLR